MFPLWKDYGLLVRVFPLSTHETTIMIEELCGHENFNDEEPLAVWMIQKTPQQWSAAMFQCIIQDVVSRCCKKLYVKDKSEDKCPYE